MREAVKIHSMIQAGVTVPLSELQAMPAYITQDLLDISEAIRGAQADEVKRANRGSN